MKPHVGSQHLVRQRVNQVARIWAIAAFVAWTMLVAAALGSTTNVADAAAASPERPRLEQRRDNPQTTVEDVSATVMCPSCDTTLDQSNSPAAERMRVWVTEAVDAGWTEQEIRDGLVEEYGGDESVLATPRAQGLGLLVWIVPALIVLVAGIGWVVLMRRWRRGSSGGDDQTRSGSSSYSHASASPSKSASSTSTSSPGDTSSPS